VAIPKESGRSESCGGGWFMGCSLGGVDSG
jgi:hypothetical protein